MGRHATVIRTHGSAATGPSAAAFETFSAVGLVAVPATATWSARRSGIPREADDARRAAEAGPAIMEEMSDRA